MAASEAQIAANRANALKSTGPKDTSKTKFNGVKHGLTARHALLPWEHEEDLEAIIEAFENRFKPVDEFERLQIKLAAEDYWRVDRSMRMEANILMTSATAEVVSSNQPVDNLHKGNLEAIAFLKASHEMEKYRRYDAHLRKAYKEALARAEKLASLRSDPKAQRLPPPKPPSQPEPVELKQASITLPIPKKCTLQVAGTLLQRKE